VRQSDSSAAAECGDSGSRADRTTDQCVVTNQASEAGGVVLVGFIRAGEQTWLHQLYLSGANDGVFVELEPRFSGSRPCKVRRGWNGNWKGSSITFGIR